MVLRITAAFGILVLASVQLQTTFNNKKPYLYYSASRQQANSNGERSEVATDTNAQNRV
jgi:hypothetical protein